MASAASRAAIASLKGDAQAREREPHDVATTAWVWAIPCAALAVVAMALLGPLLGGLLVPSHSPYTFVSAIVTGLHPEPAEQGRYLIAICAPLLAALTLPAARTWLQRVPASVMGTTAVGTQLALAALVVASIVAQYRFRFGIRYTLGDEPTFAMRYFSPATLVVAGGVTAAIAGTARSATLWRRAAAALLAESRARRVVATVLAVALTAVWMLHAVHSDAEIGNAVDEVRYHMGFTLDETFAVINGRTPLVNFTAQYGSLWPFVLALPVVAFGKTLLAFSIAACTVSALALLAVFGVLRRAVRSSAAALLLYLPFLATSLFIVGGTLRDRSTPGSYYASFPLRYALPFFVAWLAAWRIERPRGASSDWLLFTLAGLAVLNNGDFGFAAFGASAVAVLWSGRLSRRGVLRLASCALAGLATAFALVSLLTLVRAGSLPQLGRLVSYARVYVLGGFAQMPIPGVLGLHLLIYLTYVAALLVATARALRQAENRVLTGMLAWSAVFGLGAGAYWVGRSHPVALVHEFSAWGLALALLVVVAIRELGSRRTRRATIGALVALFSFGVMVCSLAQTPMPWEQLERLNAPFVPTEAEPDPNPLAASPRPSVRRFVVSLADGRSRFVVKRGAPVAILLTNGHRIADAYGVDDVVPYTGVESITTSERVREVVDALRRAGGNTIIMPNPLNLALLPVLEHTGFRQLTQDKLHPLQRLRVREPLLEPWTGGLAVFKSVDTRNLHPRALERP